MRFLCFGSINMDYVYRVAHIAAPGETVSSLGLSLFPGGKGLNQSIALARAGAEVYHAGMIGADGSLLLQELERAGVDVRFVRTAEERTGNAIIQVDDLGQNCIIVHRGANGKNTKTFVDHVLSHFAPPDVVVLQNEINLNEYIIHCAHEKGMRVALNPSPLDAELALYPLEEVDLLILNETEGAGMTGEGEPSKILDRLSGRYPKMHIVLTLGESGSLYRRGRETRICRAHPVRVVDTTAAGDTYLGYFLENFMRNGDPTQAMEIASRAAAIAISRKGASPSIPFREELDELEHGRR